MLEVRNLMRPGLEPVSFDLPAGECLVVRGRSGSGKTLLLRALADLDPSEGSVRLDGRPREAVSGPAWRRMVSYLAAEPGWWAPTVAEHFADWPAAVPAAQALALPAECGEWPIARLSTGERQRLALLRTLERRPRVLLLDEPTAALDAEAAASAEALIGARLAEGAGALWVTHDPAQAKRMGRRALALEAGRAREAAA